MEQKLRTAQRFIPFVVALLSAIIAAGLRQPFEHEPVLLVLLGGASFFALKGGYIGFLMFGLPALLCWAMAGLLDSKKLRRIFRVLGWFLWFFAGMLVAGIPV